MANPFCVIVLGGWSPGPLTVVKQSLSSRNCVAVMEPDIPMPPMKCSWLLDPCVAAFFAVLGCTSWAYHAIERQGLLLIPLTIIALGALRLCVAGIVRGSLQRGVRKTMAIMNTSKTELIVGFSWGGSVVAEMLQRGLVGCGPNQPKVLLIAPVTAVVGAICMQNDAALQVQVDESSRVHVFHASDDAFFCPHPERWANSGVTYHMCHDTHAFMRRQSQHQIVQAMNHMLQLHD